jgi:CRISPR-associated protein Cmx8
LAKTKEKPAAIEVLTIKYTLAELPSSQHRAGLAGLALIYRWLKERYPDEFQEKLDHGMICNLTEITGGATLEINQVGLETLFDEIYAATAELTRETKIRLNKKKEEIAPDEIIEEDVINTKTKQPKIDKTTGEIQKKKIYCYPVAIPKGSFLADTQYDKTSDGKNGLWIKLWRDVVWSILRGVPTTRKPFEARADGEYKEDAAKIWQELIKPEAFTVDLPSTYFLGAQAANAEIVPFKDLARYQLLLHFWLFASQIYVPQTIKIDRDKDKEKDQDKVKKEFKEVVEKREFFGYAIAIPDVTDLENFCDDFLDLLKNRGDKASGYRPLDSVIDLPIESALDLMNRLSDQLTARTGKQDIKESVLGIDVIHADKQGNNIRLLSYSRISPDRTAQRDYKRIKTSYFNPLFRRQRLINLVERKPWYMGFDALLCTVPYEQSMENKQFRRDVNTAFQSEGEDMTESIEAIVETDDDVNEEELSVSLSIEKLVMRIVKTYVKVKLKKSKDELEWNNKWKLSSKASKEEREARDNNPEYKKYVDKKSKIAKTAFFDVRSRTEHDDFIKYFAETLCSVPHRMSQENYSKITQHLYQKTDYVRTLTLLALSANS